MDLNKDFILSEDELEYYCSEHPQCYETRSLYKDFDDYEKIHRSRHPKYYDTNHDGMVDSEEFQKFYRGRFRPGVPIDLLNKACNGL